MKTTALLLALALAPEPPETLLPSPPADTLTDPFGGLPETPDPAPVVTPAPCRREDFGDFDAFVACRAEREAPTDTSKDAERDREADREADREVDREAEIAEAAAMRPTEEAPAEVDPQQIRGAGIGLVVGGFVLQCIGAGLMFAVNERALEPDSSAKLRPFFWPGVTMDFIGTGMLTTGVVLLVKARRARLKRLTGRGVGFRF